MSANAPPRSSRLRATSRWIAVRHRGSGTWAYVANRITGLALVGYLYIHLVVLSLLARGPGSYDRFVEVMRSPVFLALDVVLVAGWVIHALNGLRLTVVGLGFGVRTQRTMLIVAAVAGAVATAAAAVLLFGD